MSRARIVVLSVLLALVGAWLAARLHVSEEERVLAAYAALVHAIEGEHRGPLAAALAPALRFSGPRPVGEGALDGALERFDALFAQADSIVIARRGAIEVVVTPAFATVRAPSVVRFRAGDLFIAYRVDAALTFERSGADWLLGQVEITELRPGLL